MLELMKKELESYGAFSKKLPTVVNLVVDAIPSKTIPLRMKRVIAISELTVFASQFRRNIWHWEGFELTINSNSMIIGGSGLGKDSGVKAARRCFSTGYSKIEQKRLDLAKNAAIQAASDAGETPPYEAENYMKYYEAPPPVLIAPTTPEGLIQHLNDIGDLPLGAGSMYAGELGDELASNGNMEGIIKVIAETYDTGDKEVVYTKGKDYRSKEIKSMAFSSLLVGSPTYLLYDAAVRKKFLIAFGSKLARRVNFAYIHETIPEPSFKSVKELTAYKKAIKAKALTFREKMANGVSILTDYHLAKNNEHIQIDEEVEDLFETYFRYNYEMAKKVDAKYPLSKLVREHLQWKALKLAGTFAIFNMHDSIQVEDYIAAINFCETLNEDMANFEAQLVKEPYELFADYMRTTATTGEFELTVHELKKLAYITGTGNPLAKMKELVYLASSYDKSGVYKYSEHGISYEAIQPVDTMQVSYKKIDNSAIFDAIERGADYDEISNEKAKVARTATDGFKSAELEFKTLAGMLEKDHAYSPFVFKDGVRGRDNIISGTKFVVLDIDDSKITAKEAHYILQDINHHIALSSDKNNEFKFRVLVELDSIVEENTQVWRHFYKSVSDSLALNVDPLPQSQVFFSYGGEGREVLSVTDKSPLEVRDHLMIAHDKTNSKAISEKPLTTPQKQALINDELTTFDFAFECTQNGSLNLITAAHKARYLGMDKEDIISLMFRINDYWDSPMPEDRIQHTIVSQIERW